jgi:hypothetical protein
VCCLVAKFKAPELEELRNKYDILCFSETKLDQYDVVEINHFKALPPLNRKHAMLKSGGIIVFVRDKHNISYLLRNSSISGALNLATRQHTFRAKILIVL